MAEVRNGADWPSSDSHLDARAGRPPPDPAQGSLYDGRQNDHAAERDARNNK